MYNFYLVTVGTVTNQKRN